MNRITILALIALAACAPPPPRPAEMPKPDPAAEAWYAPAVEHLAKMARDAEALLKQGHAEDAARIITESQPLLNRVIAVPRPTLAAMEAASGLDDLYGRMLMNDHRYGWARLQFQKNAIRWKHWRPRTDDADHRLKLAESQIAECDRKLMAQ
jgi:hypothetical protein